MIEPNYPGTSIFKVILVHLCKTNLMLTRLPTFEWLGFYKGTTLQVEHYEVKGMYGSRFRAQDEGHLECTAEQATPTFRNLHNAQHNLSLNSTTQVHIIMNGNLKKLPQKDDHLESLGNRNAIEEMHYWEYFYRQNKYLRLIWSSHLTRVLPEYENLMPALVFCQSPPNHLPTVCQGQNSHEIEERNSNNASPISKVYQRLRGKKKKVRKSEQIKKASPSTLIISHLAHKRFLSFPLHHHENPSAQTVDKTRSSVKAIKLTFRYQDKNKTKQKNDFLWAPVHQHLTRPFLFFQIDSIS